MLHITASFFFFFFNDTATTEIYTLSLHDALPIFRPDQSLVVVCCATNTAGHMSRETASDHVVTWSENDGAFSAASLWRRSEEHTSELQSRQYLVCRLLLEKKKKAAEYMSEIKPNQ